MSNELVRVFALRLLGEKREIIVLKEKGQDFYAFPPYAKKPLGDLDNHMSWHESGKRHAVTKYRKKEIKSVRNKSEIQLQPPSSLKGAGLLCHIVCGVFNSFVDLHAIGTNDGKLVVLDAEAAGFRDDALFVRAYLVGPGEEHCIPIAADTGPRILHLVERTTAPWLAVEVFQQVA